MGVWEEMLERQSKNLSTGDTRAFRYTLRMKDFWADQYMLAGALLIDHDCSFRSLSFIHY